VLVESGGNQKGDRHQKNHKWCDNNFNFQTIWRYFLLSRLIIVGLNQKRTKF